MVAMVEKIPIPGYASMDLSVKERKKGVLKKIALSLNRCMLVVDSTFPT